MTTSEPRSAVGICNLALTLIGERTISSIESPNDAREETMALWYDQTRRAVLRAHPWNFAQKYTVLARSGDGDGMFDDAYALPSDFVRLNSVGEDKYNPISEYDLSNAYIWASEGNSLGIYYNRNVTEVSRMDALFIEAVAYRLAIAIGYQFTKKKSVTDMLEARFREIQGEARSIDGQERVPRRIQKSNWLSARIYGGNGARDNRYYTIE